MKLFKNLKVTALIGALLTASPALADTGLIKNIDCADTWKNNYNASNWMEMANLRAGVSMYGDVELSIKTLSKELIGADFIQTALGSKAYSGAVLTTFNVTQDAWVYIAHAHSVTAKPAWLKTFTKTTFSITNANGETFDVYSRRYAGGAQVSLGNNGAPHSAMYMVLVKPVGKWPAKPVPAGKVFDIAKYGAVGDGKTVNTKAVQAAIDACTAAGGGSVYVHDGVFITGTIILKDNVSLFVEAGTVLRGSPQKEDYPWITPTLPSYRRHEPLQLIYAEKAKNIGITGGGVIDGGAVASNRPWSNGLIDKRPRLIRMSECKGISITHVTLARSVYWTQYYEGCEDLKEDNVRIHCYTGMANQDGIDISACKNVTLSNYYAITGDDAVCIKAMSMKPTENLNIYNVFVRFSNCHAVKIGTETHGDVRNVHVNNVTCWATYGNGIEASDGSTVEDVLYENFLVKDCNVPIFMTLSQRGRVFEGGPAIAATSRMRNITIRNIVNTGVHYEDSHNGPGVASVFVGLPGQEIENIKIENCNFLLYGGLKDPDMPKVNVPEAPTAYPEYNLVGRTNAYGLYFRHVKGVTIKNTLVQGVYLDSRPAIVMDDVKSYSLIGVRAESSPMTQPYVFWHKQDGEITSSLQK